MEGIKLEIAELTLNKFDGYGITLLSFEIDFNKVITVSKGGSLFHFSICKNYQGKVQVIRLNFGLFYFIHVRKIIKIIKPKYNIDFVD